MPKIRKRKPKAIKVKRTTDRIKFKEIPTAEMVQIGKDWEDYGPGDVKGKFVKVAPMLPASERGTFPGRQIAKDLKEAGALAVIIAPVFVPDGKKATDKAPVAKNPHAEVDRWLEDSNLDDADKDAVGRVVRGYMEKEGL